MDKNKRTPLHLAARYGHDSVARLLSEKGASVEKTDIFGRNCLAFAISHGNRDVISVILECDQWEKALRNEYLTAGGVRETPLRQLIKRFPELAKDVFDKCVTTNIHSSKLKNQKTKTVSPEDPNLKVIYLKYYKLFWCLNMF